MLQRKKLLHQLLKIRFVIPHSSDSVFTDNLLIHHQLLQQSQHPTPKKSKTNSDRFTIDGQYKIIFKNFNTWHNPCVAEYPIFTKKMQKAYNRKNEYSNDSLMFRRSVFTRQLGRGIEYLTGN
jgi:hypothetical protein